MTLYLIGLVLNNEKDITFNGFEAIKKCDKIYLEEYTSKLNCKLEDLEKFYERKIEVIKREFLENSISDIVEEAKNKNIAILIPGAPLAATTHFEFILEAKKQNVEFQIIENASILTAIGITGLFLYKFGRTTTIPFDNKNIKSPYETYLNNKKLGLHTLFLLDIKNDKMMSVREGLDYLIKSGLSKDTLVVGCGALGSDDFEIKGGKAKELKIIKFPQCFIIPGELNFKEEEAVKLWQAS